MAARNNRARSARSAGAPPGPRQRDRRQAGLIDAAASLFVEKGVAATSIEDIAESAGVTKSTFYHYFADRAALLDALRSRYSQRFDDVTRAAMGANAATDWEARLRAWTSETAKQYLATYRLHDAIFHDQKTCHRFVISEEDFVVGLADLLSAAAAAGEWSVKDPRTTAAFMFHGMHGLLDEAILQGTDTEQITALLFHLFRNIVGPARS